MRITRRSRSTHVRSTGAETVARYVKQNGGRPLTARQSRRVRHRQRLMGI